MTHASAWGLPPTTVEGLRAILRSEPRVERAILFGSRAKGTHRPGSDIDIAIDGPQIDLDVLTHLMRAFDESTIPYQVDLC